MSEITKPIFLDETGQAMVSALQSIALITSGFVGAPGAGVPSGGTTGQILKKKSNTDYDTEWSTANSISSYTSNPAALGTASPGLSADYARGDHVHPLPSASDVGAAPAWSVVEVNDSGAVTQSLNENTFYKFTGTLTSLEVDAGGYTGMEHYHFRFTTPTAITLSVPQIWTMPDSFTCEAGKMYEVDVLDGLAVVQSWSLS